MTTGSAISYHNTVHMHSKLLLPCIQKGQKDLKAKIGS